MGSPSVSGPSEEMLSQIAWHASGIQQGEGGDSMNILFE